MRSSKIFLAPALLLIALFSAAMANADDWTLLGSRVVNDRTDVDVIPVGPAAGEFSRIRLDAGHSPVAFKRVVITFGNGKHQTIERDFLVVRKGGGVVIDLKGGKRTVLKVKMVYEARSPGFRKATIQLFGR